MEPSKEAETDAEVERPSEKANSRGMIITMLVVLALFALLIGWEVYYQSKT